MGSKLDLHVKIIFFIFSRQGAKAQSWDGRAKLLLSRCVNSQCTLRVSAWHAGALAQEGVLRG